MKGFLLIDKPEGITSNQVLNTLKRKSKAKIGHTGTLDPFATGLLVVGLGEALKFIPYLQEEPKVYEAALLLGSATDTLDKMGRVVDERPVGFITREEIEVAFEIFLGDQDQIPPMYSAKKVKGKKLYELARQGQEIVRAASKIFINRLELLEWSRPLIHFRVSCSRGTYVRVLAQDIAIKLNTVGHLKSLRRLSAGKFNVEKSIPLSEDLKFSENLISIEDALTGYPHFQAEEEEVQKLQWGQSLEGWDLKAGTYLLFQGDRFIGMGLSDGSTLSPERLIHESKTIL